MQGLQSIDFVSTNRNSGKIRNNSDCFAGVYRTAGACIRFILCITVLVCIFTFSCSATGLDEQYNELYTLLEIEDVEDLTKDEINKYTEAELEIENPESFWQINGFELIKNVITKAVSIDGSSLNILSLVLIITIVYTLTTSLVERKKSLAVSYDTVTSTVCALLLLSPISMLIYDVCEAVRSCCVFMNAFIPVYAAMFMVMGKNASSASYSTLMFTVTQVFTILADKVFAPLSGVMLTASVGSTFGSISKRFYELLKKTMVISLSTSMGIFITVLNLQTAISTPSDTVGIKTVKTALGALVPIVGSALSDSVSVLIAGAGTLKSTLGAYAVISVVVLIVPALIRLLIWRITAALCCAILELGGAEAAVNIVKCFGSVITLMISVMLCVAVAYILSVILTLSAGV